MTNTSPFYIKAKWLENFYIQTCYFQAKFCFPPHIKNAFWPADMDRRHLLEVGDLLVPDREGTCCVDHFKPVSRTEVLQFSKIALVEVGLAECASDNCIFVAIPHYLPEERFRRLLASSDPLLIENAPAGRIFYIDAERYLGEELIHVPIDAYEDATYFLGKGGQWYIVILINFHYIARGQSVVKRDFSGSRCSRPTLLSGKVLSAQNRLCPKDNGYKSHQIPFENTYVGWLCKHFQKGFESLRLTFLAYYNVVKVN